MRPRDLALGVLVTAVWGSNFSVIGLGLRSLDPFLLTALRFLCSALPLVFLLAPPRVPARVVVAYGMLFGVGLWWVVNLAMARGMAPGLSSLVLQASAFFTILLSRAVFGEPIGRARWWGMAAAALGLVVIIAASNAGTTRIGAALVLLAALAWSACNLLVKRHKPDDMLAFIAWSSLVAAPVLLLLTFLGEGARPFVELPSRLDARAVFSILFQAYVTTVFGYWVWNRLVARYSAAQVAPLSLLVPVSGLVTAWLVFDERLPLATWVGVALVLAGMARLTFPGSAAGRPGLPAALPGARAG
jgi:O-acetylserine/cysteine efflux transporter